MDEKWEIKLILVDTKKCDYDIFRFVNFGKYDKIRWVKWRRKKDKQE